MSVSDAAPAEAVRFMLDTDFDAGLLPRVLEPFAKRGLTPDRLWSHRGARAVHIEVALDTAPAEAIHLIEGNLRQVVGVRVVTVLRRAKLQYAA